MTNVLFFLLGVLIGNIIDIKYVLIFYVIYVVIKNDPINNTLYPRALLYDGIIWVTTKYYESKKYNYINDETRKIVEVFNNIEINVKTPVIKEYKTINFLELPPPLVIPDRF